MAHKSPTISVKSREMIGGDQFSQRREIFEKHDTVFLPLPSPTAITPTYREVEPIITTNHGITTANFKRNTSGYSSMRESRNEDRQYDYRPRKYSDNFTSELNQSDDVDYRHSMADRNRRLLKLRRDFLKSNLHEPGETGLHRGGVRASLPTNTASSIKYKIENLNIHKFPFAEPYSTPTPTRRIVVDLGSPGDAEVNGDDKEHQGVEQERHKHRSLSNDSKSSSPTIDHQKLYEELVKRYSPQRKPVDWTLPPTRPKVVGSVPKSTSSTADSVDSVGKKETETDDVFENKNENKTNGFENSENTPEKDTKPNVLHNGEVSGAKDAASKANDSKVSLSELEENDYVPELSTFKQQSPSIKKPPLENIVDLTIPLLIDKMTEEGEQNIQKAASKKVKRKRSFIDKLLGRNKSVKSEK